MYRYVSGQEHMQLGRNARPFSGPIQGQIWPTVRADEICCRRTDTVLDSDSDYSASQVLLVQDG
jgi:hypothetical protein